MIEKEIYDLFNSFEANKIITSIINEKIGYLKNS